MKLKLFITATLIGALAFTTGCRDEFADVNTKPSILTKPDVRYLFTKALSEFEPSGYQQWFYNNLQYMLPWTQATLSQDDGNPSSMNLMGAYEGSQNKLINVKVRVEEIRKVISEMDAEEAEKYENISAICNPLMVYLGIFGTDMYGSLAYTEAGQILINTNLLTPKYETQEELFNLWLQQLDETIKVLNTSRNNQVSLGNQDFVFGGNVSKWAKFANSLKLKIAVRLLHIDKAKALQIAQEVANSPIGIMSSLEDDFIYCKGAQEYHFGDDLWGGYGSKQLIGFMVGNLDPRVRFMFQKNDFNSLVVQAFLDAGKALPSYIKEVVNTKTENGKVVFESWKAPGEPWVRYHGAPISIYAKDDGTINDNYFNTTNFKIDNKTYVPLAKLNHREMLQGDKSYTFPDAPGTSAVIDNQKNAWYGLHFSSAEVNLYLAELSLLGASLPQSAETYFQQGVRLSVGAYDKLASLNKVPYYSEVYDPIEATTSLKSGEIDALLQKDAYKLEGSTMDKLEKVYIQQYIHLLYFPTDMYSMVRRSGIPMRGSKYLAWEDFSRDNDVNYPIPRRFTISSPLETDLMFQIKTDAFKAQGFTTGSLDPKTLNTERVWYDKGAPNFGEGPNF